MSETKKDRAKALILAQRGTFKAKHIEREFPGFVSRSTVTTAIRELCQEGLVCWAWGGGRNTTWRIIKESVKG